MTAVFAILGWAAAVIFYSLLRWTRKLNAHQLERKNNAIDWWRRENKRLKVELDDALMRVEELTPRRVHGRFASKREEI